MAKAELKTKKTKASVEGFLNGIADEEKRIDSFRLLEIMQRLSGDEAQLWSSGIVGFGTIHIKYATGREIDWIKIGFSPRRANFSLYISCDIGRHGELLKKLGKHKTGVGCLYIKRLRDVDEVVLEKLIKASLKKMLESANGTKQ